VSLWSAIIFKSKWSLDLSYLISGKRLSKYIKISCTVFKASKSQWINFLYELKAMLCASMVWRCLLYHVVIGVEILPVSKTVFPWAFFAGVAIVLVSVMSCPVWCFARSCLMMSQIFNGYKVAHKSDLVWCYPPLIFCCQYPQKVEWSAL
jgi:hypothetical protein